MVNVALFGSPVTGSAFTTGFENLSSCKMIPSQSVFYSINHVVVLEDDIRYVVLV